MRKSESKSILKAFEQSIARTAHPPLKNLSWNLLFVDPEPRAFIEELKLAFDSSTFSFLI